MQTGSPDTHHPNNAPYGGTILKQPARHVAFDSPHDLAEGHVGRRAYQNIVHPCTFSPAIFSSEADRLEAGGFDLVIDNKISPHVVARVNPDDKTFQPTLNSIGLFGAVPPEKIFFFYTAEGDRQWTTV